jgi:hypothetical protein
VVEALYNESADLVMLPPNSPDWVRAADPVTRGRPHPRNETLEILRVTDR